MISAKLKKYPGLVEAHAARRRNAARRNPIERITRAYIRVYGDSGQRTAYVEWVDGKGKSGRTEGKPSGLHMKALLARAKREGLTIEKEKWNPDSWRGDAATARAFRSGARASAKQVTKIRRVRSRHAIGSGTQEAGEIIQALPGGWLKVKWDNGTRPTLVKRSEIKRFPHVRNPARKPALSLTALQEKAIELLNQIRPKGRRGSGQRQAMQRRAVRVWYYKASAKLGYTQTQIAQQWRDVLDMEALERDAINPGIMDLAGSVQAFEYLAQKAGPDKRRKRRANASKTGKIYRTCKTCKGTGKRGDLDCRKCDGMGVVLEDENTFEKLKRQTRQGKRNPYRPSAKLLSVHKKIAEKITRISKEAQEAYNTGDEVKAKKLWAQADKLYNRLTASTERSNPSVTEMSERFQGSASGKATEYYASDYAPRLDFSRAGALVFLKLKGTTIRVPGAVVAIDPKTEKLWIAGSDARPMFTRKASRKGELLDYGPVDAICYLTAKRHIGNGKQFEYVHSFGEEGGKKPSLQIDHDGMPVLKGGSYKIEDRGIVN